MSGIKEDYEEKSAVFRKVGEKLLASQNEFREHLFSVHALRE